MVGFPCSSAGKESACNAGDPCSIPGLGGSPGKGTDYPLQYFWVFLMAQMVNNPPAMKETQVQFLDWKDPLEKGMATHSSILAWRIPWTEEFIQQLNKSAFLSTSKCELKDDTLFCSLQYLKHLQLPETHTEKLEKMFV